MKKFIHIYLYSLLSPSPSRSAFVPFAPACRAPCLVLVLPLAHLPGNERERVPPMPRTAPSGRAYVWIFCPRLAGLQAGELGKIGA